MKNYQLVGSPTSPYVRRFRLWLEGVPFTFDAVKDMYGADDARLSTMNPLKRVPLLLVDGRPLFESRVMYNHLREALGRRPLELEDENAISVVDTLQDQLVQGFLMKKYGHPVHAENEYFKRHTDRRERMLAYLREESIAGRFDRWDYPAISLFCLLDWAAFRGALETRELVGPMMRVMDLAKSQAHVAATDPRKA